MNNMARRLGVELQPHSSDLGHAAASDDSGDHNQQVVRSPRKSGTWVVADVAHNSHPQCPCPSALSRWLLLSNPPGTIILYPAMALMYLYYSEAMQHARIRSPSRFMGGIMSMIMSRTHQHRRAPTKPITDQTPAVKGKFQLSGNTRFHL